MREFFHNMKLSFLLAAVLYIILGLILLIWPGVQRHRVFVMPSAASCLFTAW